LKCVTYNLVIKMNSNYEMLVLVLESIANFFYFQNQMQLDSSSPNIMRDRFVLIFSTFVMIPKCTRTLLLEGSLSNLMFTVAKS